MSDEGGFDPCECFNFHEIAMRRLLNMLRQSQSYCTDSECVDDITGASLQRGNDEGIFMMSVMFVMALLIYYLRPNRFRTKNTSEKPCFNERDSNGAPPTPPPSSC
ncbi:small integral membrane protein 14 [Onthophagus taurus]|uniref:small integral membrane protein 14 n=1 Tax=Onthophagus taurus TaxID=166361 RepID=UPI000C20E28A|nr:small integral membrane protein 14 [Onthophagus taurus]